MRVRILGAHNSESRTSRCVCILVDETLAMDAGGLTSNLQLEEQVKIKAILVSHYHFDHIRDIPGLALNLYKRGAGTTIYSMPEVRDNVETHLLNTHSSKVKKIKVSFSMPNRKCPIVMQSEYQEHTIRRYRWKRY